MNSGEGVLQFIAEQGSGSLVPSLSLQPKLQSWLVSGYDLCLPCPVAVLPLSPMSLSAVGSCMGSVASQPRLWQHLPLSFVLLVRLQGGGGCAKSWRNCLEGSLQCIRLAGETLGVDCIRGMQFSPDLPEQGLSRAHHGSHLPKKNLQIPQFVITGKVPMCHLSSLVPAPDAPQVWFLLTGHQFLHQSIGGNT